MTTGDFDALGAGLSVSRIRVSEDAVSLAVRGDIDLATAPRLVSEVTAAQRIRDTVRVDLSGVQFIDVIGLRALLLLAGQAQRAGRRFVLEEPSVPVRRLVAITGTAEQLGVR